MSLQDVSQPLDELGVKRSHVAIHEWVHKVDVQPLSTVTADQLSVDEKVIRLHGQDHWLYGVVDPTRTKFFTCACFRPQRNRRRGGFWTSYTVAITSTTWYFSWTVRIILDQCSLKTATDSRSFNMRIGMLSNVFFRR